MFLTEDCPANVASPKASELPPDHYAFTPIIPRILWKCPPKVHYPFSSIEFLTIVQTCDNSACVAKQFIINDALLVASGGESTEAPSENLRIAKVLEAFYPHRSVIPTR